MLRLISLELAGFKSFADRTRLEFPEGITAVIGPNGCGKSNLADAIGFVLGIQTAKDLRGQRMEDFIFGGTKRRKSSGLAEVTVRFRRTGEAPVALDGVELQGDEIDITHKLYRSGESVYLVNQRRCRLMDIHRFLEEAGLGFSGYAMIAQGKIESFLAARPLERRGLLEEAARISGYKARRRNAEVKLELAQQNLLRVNDILVEVERQLRSLARQAAKTRSYRRVREEFREVQKLRLKLEADRIGSRLRDRLGALLEARTEERRLGGLVEEQELTSHRLGDLRAELEVRAQDLQDRNAETTLQLDRTRGAIRYAEQQLEQTTRARQSEATERDGIRSALANLESEAARCESELACLGVEQAAAAHLQADLQLRVDAARAELEQSDRGLEETRSRLVALVGETASLHNQSEQSRARLHQVQADRLRVQQGLDRLRDRLAVLATQLEELRRAEGEGKSRLADSRQLVVDLKAEVVRLSSELQELRERETSLNSQHVAVRERLQSLQELETSRAHYSEGVKKVLSHLNRSRTVQTSGTLADAVETSPEFERLVEEFLDEELECILVDSLDEALRGVSEVRSLKSGKCSFMSLISTNGFGKSLPHRSGPALPGLEEGVYGRLGDLLKMKPDVQAAFVRVFPQQSEAIVVSDLERAMVLAHSHPETTFLTLAGESLQPRGLVAATAASGNKLGLLGLKRQLRELQVRAEKHLAAASEAREARAAKEELLRETRLCLEKAQEALYRLEKEVLNLAHGIEQAESDQRRQEREAAAHDVDLNRLAEEEVALAERVEVLGQDLGKASEAKERIEAELAEGRTRVAQHREQLAAAQVELNGAVSQLRLREERRQSLDSTLHRIQRQIVEADTRLRSSLAKDSAAEQRAAELTAEVERRQREVLEQAAETESLSASLTSIREEMATRRKEAQELDAILDRLRVQLTGVRSVCSEIEVERARLETQQQHLEEYSQEQLQAPLAEALAGVEATGEDPREIDTKYENLRQRLEAFGPINMTALTEYQEAEARQKFLAEQKADLEKSIADTTQAIQELNRRSRAQFVETFNQVNRNFQEVFKKLFGGGECGMQLLDEDDVLECGIDLYAQPPGKKLQNVMLLSGGEKALTVFALLVGIFMHRPSRFCVLDEVDAPLDDANVQRFAHLVREMSHDTQFIVVTHNKRTMEHAHAMYGVTMEEAGISKVVSAKF